MHTGGSHTPPRATRLSGDQPSLLRYARESGPGCSQPLCKTQPLKTGVVWGHPHISFPFWALPSPTPGRHTNWGLRKYFQGLSRNARKGSRFLVPAAAVEVGGAGEASISGPSVPPPLRSWRRRRSSDQDSRDRSAGAALGAKGVGRATLLHTRGSRRLHTPSRQSVCTGTLGQALWVRGRGSAWCAGAPCWPLQLQGYYFK